MLNGEKTVILLQEVDVCLLAIAREQAVQCWALESCQRGKLTKTLKL